MLDKKHLAVARSILFVFGRSVSRALRPVSGAARHLRLGRLGKWLDGDRKETPLAAPQDVDETANPGQSRFLAAVHHDLCQPLYAINLYLGTLASLDLDARARALVAKTRDSAQTMEKMVRSLLDWSRLNASAVQPTIEVFPIALALDGVRTQFERQAREKGIDVRIADCSALVCSDPEIVERILRNLVENALTYSTRGRILVGCRRRGSWLRLEVHDTGPGIPDGTQRAVFNEWYQLHNPERDRARDLGLRLPIVQGLAKVLALPLTLVSRPGQGSIFAIDVPRATQRESC